ncbi:MAG: methylhydantoinase, partial [Deltaproteobacteria bacterium]|nr:methylhydantoinase [Deltaproteobacteria bacterium]
TIGISKTTPVEVMEQFYPVLFEEYSLHEGSGGAGKQRGGFGVNYKIKLRRGTAKVSMVMDHGRFGPQGVLGGSDGGVNRVHVERDAETYIPPHLSKDQNILVEVGNTIHVSTPGGGGYEDPFLRNPELVLHDLKRGYYSEKQAQELFGVVLNSLEEVDSKATEKLREAQ